MRHSRIELQMTGMDIVIALAEGNPGAITVMGKMFEVGEAVDPDSALGPLNGLVLLDAYHIYGSRIWRLYKDVCGQDISRTLGVLRCAQFGIIDSRDLGHDIDTEGPQARRINIEDALAKLIERLPRFQLKAPEVNNG